MGINFPNDEIFLTTEEVLEYLQVNLRTVYRLIKAGKIPAVRVGRQWRFRKRDIDAWLDSQRPRGERSATSPAERTSRTNERPRVLVVAPPARHADAANRARHRCRVCGTATAVQRGQRGSSPP